MVFEGLLNSHISSWGVMWPNKFISQEEFP